MKLIKKDKKLFKIINLILIIFLPLILFNYLYTGKKDFGLVALNKDTTKKIEKINNKKIICTGYKDYHECLKLLNDKSRETIILLGNSQLFAINQMKADDYLTSYYLSKEMEKEKINFITFALPNGSLTEHLIIYDFLNSKFKIDTLILPLIFDDLREAGIRDDVKNFFNDKEFKNYFLTTDHKKKIFKKIYPDSIEVKKKKTTQEISENKILNFLNSCCNYEEKRDGISGEIFVTLYNLRNTIFNITSTSKRKLLAGSYEQNLNSFMELINITNDNNTKLLSYIAPIRNDIAIPYVENEYEKFKQEIFILSKKENFTHVNLEDLIPKDLWGTAAGAKFGVDDEIDFMHFKGEGHKILSQKIINILSNDF